MPLFALTQTKHIFSTFFVFLILLISNISVAHEISPSVVDITIDEDQRYQMSIRLNLEATIAKIGINHDDTEDSDKAHIYDGLRQMPFNELIEEFAEFEPELLEKVLLKFNGEKQTLSIDGVNIPDVGDLDLARTSMINFSGKLPENSRSLIWQWDASFGNAVLRVRTADNPELHSSYLQDGKASDEITLTESDNFSLWDKFTNYMTNLDWF